MAPLARRGEVWFAEVPGDKRRPVLVLTRDPMGRLLHSAICAPITSTVRGLSTEVALGAEAGLAQGSVPIRHLRLSVLIPPWLFALEMSDKLNKRLVVRVLYENFLTVRRK